MLLGPSAVSLAGAVELLGGAADTAAPPVPGSYRMDAVLMLLGAPLPDPLDPGFHCVRTHWIRGFMAFRLARRTRTVMLMVPVCPESGFLSEDGRYVAKMAAMSCPAEPTVPSAGMPNPANAVKLYDKGDGSEEMCLKLRTQPEPATGLRQACANRHHARVMIVRWAAMNSGNQQQAVRLGRIGSRVIPAVGSLRDGNGVRMGTGSSHGRRGNCDARRN